MRVRRFIGWFALALLMLTVGAGIWVWNADLGRFKGPIETALSERLGREFRAGQLSLRLGSTVSLSAGDVWVGNPAWAPEESLLNVGHVEADILLSSLFDDGPIVIERAVIESATLAYFRDMDGRHSFEFETPAAEAPEPAPTARTKPVPVVFRKARLEDGRVRLTDAKRDLPIDIVIDNLAIVEQEDRMLDVLARGSINDLPMDYMGRLGPLDTLFGGGALSFEGEGSFGTLSVSGSGLIDDLVSPDRPQAALRLSGPDIRDVERLLGLEPDTPASYAIDLEITPETDHLGIALDGEIGEFTIDLLGQMEGLQSLDGVAIDVHVRGPDLRTPLRIVGIDNVPRRPFELLGVVKRQGRRLVFENVSSVIGDTTFDLNGTLSDFTNLRDSNLRLDVAGPDVESFRELLGLPGLAEGAFELHLELEPSAQGIGIISGRIQSNLARIQLSGLIGDQGNYVGTEATVSIAGPNAQAVFETFGVEGLRPDPFEIDGEIAVEGDRIRIRTATLTGLLDTRVEASGSVGYDLWSPATELQLQVSGPDIGRTFRQTGFRLPRWQGEYEFETRLRATPAGIRLDGLNGTIARSSLRADALIPLDPSLDGLDITFEAQGPDLEALLADSVDVDVPAVAWSAAAHLRRIREQLLVDDLALQIAETSIEGGVDLPWPADFGTGRFRLAASGPDLSRILPRVSDFRPSAEPFDLMVDGTVEDGDWRFNQARLGLERAVIELSGTFDQLPDFSATDLTINATAPDLSRLGSWDRESLPSVPLELSTHLTGATDDLKLDRIHLELGTTEVDGRFRYNQSGPIPFIGVELSSDRIDLRDVLPPPLDGEDAPPPEDGRVIPDLPLPLEALAARNADIDIRIGEFQTHRRITNDVVIDAQISDGGIVIERYRTRGMNGDVRARGSLIPRPDGQADLALRLDANDLAPTRETWQNADPATLPQINAVAEVTARGSDVRSLAASLSGDGMIYATEGTLPGDGLSALHLGILDILLGLLAPEGESKQPTNLVCFAGRIKAENGLLTTEPIAAMRTERMLIMGSGSINLTDERLDLGFEVIPSKTFSLNLAELANSLIRIRGTLATPRVEIDPAGTLIYGGAAAATAGLSILAKGLVDRVRKSSQPCERLKEAVIEEANQRFREALPE